MQRRILFLCTGNSARSQMAEALLRKRAGHVFEALSAGTEPKAEVFLPVVEVLKEVGVDLSAQQPKDIGQYLGQTDLEKVIIVCADAEEKCPATLGSAGRIFWPFEDPAKANGSREEVLDVCRKVRDQIDRRICEWLKEQGVDAQT